MASFRSFSAPVQIISAEPYGGAHAQELRTSRRLRCAIDSPAISASDNLLLRGAHRHPSRDRSRQDSSAVQWDRADPPARAALGRLAMAAWYSRIASALRFCVSRKLRLERVQTIVIRIDLRGARKKRTARDPCLRSATLPAPRSTAIRSAAAPDRRPSHRFPPPAADRRPVRSCSRDRPAPRRSAQERSSAPRSQLCNRAARDRNWPPHGRRSGFFGSWLRACSNICVARSGCFNFR